jgi:DNA-directed RNA polymerase specialized sigma subunit
MQTVNTQDNADEQIPESIQVEMPEPSQVQFAQNDTSTSMDENTEESGQSEPIVMTGLKLFMRDELLNSDDMDEDELLQKWDELDEESKNVLTCTYIDLGLPRRSAEHEFQLLI